MRSSCLFVLEGIAHAEAPRALARVRTWLSPLGVDVAGLWHPGCACLIGVAHRDTLELPPDEGLFSWGEAAPAALSRSGPVLAAGPEKLGALDRSTALLAYDRARVRLVSGCSGLLSLYAAGADRRSSWSTSAVVAALLVQESDRVRIDPAHLPQLFAFGFIGGTATHLAGVTAVSPATVIDLAAQRPSATFQYRSPADRWRPMPAEDAADHADRCLLEGLQARVAGVPYAYLGLTGGMDSRVVAVALAELGVAVPAMTWGATGQPDVAAAEHVSRRLGLPHATLSGGWHTEQLPRAQIDEAARWNEGLASPPLLGRPEWPEDLRTFVTGGGGETARAFYYRLLHQLRENPTIDQVAALWRPEATIAEASRSAQDVVAAAKLDFLAEAAATGHAGWRLLDIVYADQRFRRWGRGILPRGPDQVVAALSGAELHRALVSLPDDARVTDGWHRRFVDLRVPDLSLAPPPAPRRGIPAPLRRVADRRRRARPAPPARHPYADTFAARPQVSEWILDQALGCQPVVDAMGEAWQRWARRGFVAGASDATEQALQAAGLAALDAALRNFARSAASTRAP